MEIDFETITPETANQYLQKLSGRQRGARDGLVKRLAAAIVAGDFVPNGDAIRFDTNGELIDGQHRLRACVQAGRAIQSLVIRGLAPETYTTIDTGATRLARDMLRWDGVKRPADKAAIVGAYMRIRNRAASVEDVRRIATAHDATLNSLIPVKDRLHGWRVSGSHVAAALLYLTEQGVTIEDLTPFTDGLIEGAGLDRGDPVLLLREALISANSGKLLQGDNATRVRNLTALVVAAWNAHVRGVQLARLVIHKSDDRSRYVIPAVRLRR